MKVEAVRGPKFLAILRKYGSNAPLAPTPVLVHHEPNDPLAILLTNFLLWESTPELADEALARLSRVIVDVNELRVMLERELAETIGSKYPFIEERALRLRAALNDVFRRQHRTSLDHLRNASRKDQRGYLEGLPEIPPFVSGRTLLAAFEHPAAVVDDTTVEVLLQHGAVEPTSTTADVVAWISKHHRADEMVKIHNALTALKYEACAAAGKQFTKIRAAYLARHAGYLAVENAARQKIEDEKQAKIAAAERVIEDKRLAEIAKEEDRVRLKREAEEARVAAKIERDAQRVLRERERVAHEIAREKALKKAAHAKQVAAVREEARRVRDAARNKIREAAAAKKAAARQIEQDRKVALKASAAKKIAAAKAIVDAKKAAAAKKIVAAKAAVAAKKLAAAQKVVAKKEAVAAKKLAAAQKVAAKKAAVAAKKLAAAKKVAAVKASATAKKTAAKKKIAAKKVPAKKSSPSKSSIKKSASKKSSSKSSAKSSSKSSSKSAASKPAPKRSNKAARKAAKKTSRAASSSKSVKSAKRGRRR